MSKLDDYSVVLFSKLNDYEILSKGLIVDILKDDGFTANKGATIFVHPQMSGALKIKSNPAAKGCYIIEKI